MVSLEFLSQCPVCRQSLNVVALQGHLESFHIGQGDAWRCGDCRFSGLTFNEIAAHVVNFHHGAARIRRDRDKEAALIDALGELQAALKGGSALPVPKAQVKSEYSTEPQTQEPQSGNDSLKRPYPAENEVAYGAYPGQPYPGYGGYPPPVFPSLFKTPFPAQPPPRFLETPVAPIAPRHYGRSGQAYPATPMPPRHMIPPPSPMPAFPSLEESHAEEPERATEQPPTPQVGPPAPPAQDHNSLACPECCAELDVNLRDGKFRYSLVEEHVEREHLPGKNFACVSCGQEMVSQGEARGHAKSVHRLSKTAGSYSIIDKAFGDRSVSEIRRLFPVLGSRAQSFRLRYNRHTTAPPRQAPKEPKLKPVTAFKVPEQPQTRVSFGGAGMSPVSDRLVTCKGCDKDVSAYDGKGFRKDSIMSHLEKSHTSAAAFLCTACGFAAKWRREVQIHTKAAHGSITPESITARKEELDAIADQIPDFFPMLPAARDKIRNAYDQITTVKTNEEIAREGIDIRRKTDSPANAGSAQSSCVACGSVVKTGEGGVAAGSALLEHVEMEHMGGKQIYGCSLCPDRFASHTQFARHCLGEHQQPYELDELLGMVTTEIRGKVAAHFPSASYAMPGTQD